MRIVPVLGQDVRGVRRYIEDVGFPFDILIDETRDVARAYGVWHRFGIASWNIARPAVFVIDRDRTVRHVFVGRRQSEFPSQHDIVRWVDGD